jgi:hypothetical protein
MPNTAGTRSGGVPGAYPAAGMSGRHTQPRPQAECMVRSQITGKLFPGSQRDGRAAAILARSGRRGHDARIFHRDRDGTWLAGRLGGLGAVRGLRCRALIRQLPGCPPCLRPGCVSRRRGDTYATVRCKPNFAPHCPSIHHRPPKRAQTSPRWRELCRQRSQRHVAPIEQRPQLTRSGY